MLIDTHNMLKMEILKSLVRTPLGGDEPPDSSLRQLQNIGQLWRHKAGDLNEVEANDHCQ